MSAEREGKLFSRGVCVSDLKEIAIKGPNIFNPTAIVAQLNHRPYAPFFYHEHGTIGAETRAVYVAHEHGALPVVITLKVTPENFPLIRMRMAKVIQTNQPTVYDYETPRNYDALTGDQYIISLARLDAEVLKQLEVGIGLIGAEGRFIYESYEEFCREIRAGIEGCVREFRNV